MTAIEIVLILIGIVFMIGSFFVSEKLSDANLQEMSESSHVEINRILEKELEDVERKVKDKVEDAIDLSIEHSLEKVQRELEKETNEKIMAIDDFSNTVIEGMNKTHNEIMFLYSMLNDKHAAISETSVELQQLMPKIQSEKENVLKNIEEVQALLQKTELKSSESLDVVQESPSMLVMDEAFDRIVMMEESEQKENDSILQDEKLNHNTEILKLHKQGKSNVEIAKTLGLGMGEVKLVLDLFREEELE